MIKDLALTSLLLSSVTMMPGAVMAKAPTSYEVTVVCPNTQGNQNVVTNFGSYIGGYGVEYILSQTLQAYFQSTGSVKNVPANVTNYFNDSVTYNPSSGEVTCSYQSNNPIEPRFTVTYGLTNGQGGVVQSQSNNVMTVSVPVGIK